MKLIIRKGGKGSGHHGHKGRPGLVGGGQPGTGTTVADPYEASQRINIATYDRAQKVPHGDLFEQTLTSAPYETREQFVSKFVDKNPVARASRTAKPWTEEGLLWGIRKALEAYGNDRQTLISGKDLEKATGLGERDLDYMTSHYAREWLAQERTHGLYQFRVRQVNGYRFDMKNGIVSEAEALNTAMKKFGYRDAGKLYDYLMKL